MNEHLPSTDDIEAFGRARLARDARFDGHFFTAVKTTGIYCRPICPAKPPLEKNVEYHLSAASASQAGFRPCLRCRPDSAPSSWAWLGSETSLRRAISLIEQGALQNGNLEKLAERLGLSSRYVRKLFNKHLGISPKQYALYQQCLFAKKLLHESDMPISDVAFAAGFNSVRRFNDVIQKELALTPRQIRKSTIGHAKSSAALKMHYRPPYEWQAVLDFLSRRVIPGLEWVEGDRYGRTITYKDARGTFEVRPDTQSNALSVNIELDKPEYLNPVFLRIRQCFDVDAPIADIDDFLSARLSAYLSYQKGLRIPAIWHSFEAGVRAILGQQVSVVAAQQLVTQLVHELGEPSVNDRMYFPSPESLANSDLSFFRMPQSRKDTLHRLAELFLSQDELSSLDIDSWQSIKGIGPWTVNYVKLRSGTTSDVWLTGDAGIKNALALVECSEQYLQSLSPWRSYVTFQLWNQL